MIFPTTLPDPSKLKAIMQSMATLDAIFCPEWQYRYYSFDTDWGPSEQMGSMRQSVSRPSQHKMSVFARGIL